MRLLMVFFVILTLSCGDEQTSSPPKIQNAQYKRITKLNIQDLRNKVKYDFAFAYNDDNCLVGYSFLTDSTPTSERKIELKLHEKFKCHPSEINTYDNGELKFLHLLKYDIDGYLVSNVHYQLGKSGHRTIYQKKEYKYDLDGCLSEKLEEEPSTVSTNYLRTRDTYKYSPSSIEEVRSTMHGNGTKWDDYAKSMYSLTGGRITAADLFYSVGGTWAKTGNVIFQYANKEFLKEISFIRSGKYSTSIRYVFGLDFDDWPSEFNTLRKDGDQGVWSKIAINGVTYSEKIWSVPSGYVNASLHPILNIEWLLISMPFNLFWSN